MIKTSGMCWFKGPFWPELKALTPIRDVLWTDPKLSAQLRDRSLRSLYCCSDGVRGRGAPMTNLSHNASFHSNERIAPSNRGIKHLGNACVDFVPEVARAKGPHRDHGFQVLLLHHHLKHRSQLSRQGSDTGPFRRRNAWRQSISLTALAACESPGHHPVLHECRHMCRRATGVVNAGPSATGWKPCGVTGIRRFLEGGRIMHLQRAE